MNSIRNASRYFEGNGPNDLYIETLREIRDFGSPVSSRGLATKEIRPVMIVFNSPRERFLFTPGRKLHPFFLVMESIWILGGRGDTDFISYYLKNILQFSDGKKEFNAPYGKRMRAFNCHRSNDDSKTISSIDQFKNAYLYLSKDPETRHALMTFWNPNFDNIGANTIDRPCNVSQHFLIRDGKLDLTIFCRSNDINLGLFNANIVQFSVILETMAMLLDIPIGKQIHFIDSLHYYIDDSITERVLSSEFPSNNFYNFIKPSCKFAFDEITPEQKMSDFNADLFDFFMAEEKIRKGEDCSFFLEKIKFNYLRDALLLARSFFLYKEKKYLDSAIVLSLLQFEDIFISATEFVARKISSKKDILTITDLVGQKFDYLTNSQRELIDLFILNH